MSTMRLPVFLLFVSVTASTTDRRPYAPDPSVEHLLKLIGPRGQVGQEDPAWDCTWRELAAKYATQIQPWLTSTQKQDLSDALQLEVNEINAQQNIYMLSKILTNEQQKAQILTVSKNNDGK